MKTFVLGVFVIKTGSIVTLVDILLRRPELVRKLEIPDNKLKLRLIYRYA